jgi:hypothetical protein
MDQWPELRRCMADVAVDCGICERREVVRIDNVYDLQEFRSWIRQRAVDMADTPTLDEVQRWCVKYDKRTVWSCREVNRRFLDYCLGRSRLDLAHADYWEEVFRDAQGLHQAWFLMCLCQYDSPHGRREALARLRDLLGPESYAEMDMPCPLPLWRFERK